MLNLKMTMTGSSTVRQWKEKELDTGNVQVSHRWMVFKTIYKLWNALKGCTGF